MAKKPKKHPPVTLALLDDGGLLTGYETGPAASATDRRIVVPEGCDLAPGKYRWDGEAFLPLRPAQPSSEAEPDALRAMALFVMAAANGKPAPAEAVAWAEWYLKSIDARKAGQ
jgi:hypothetical protein